MTSEQDLPPEPKSIHMNKEIEVHKLIAVYTLWYKRRKPKERRSIKVECNAQTFCVWVAENKAVCLFCK